MILVRNEGLAAKRQIPAFPFFREKWSFLSFLLLCIERQWYGHHVERCSVSNIVLQTHHAMHDGEVTSRLHSLAFSPPFSPFTSGGGCPLVTYDLGRSTADSASQLFRQSRHSRACLAIHSNKACSTWLLKSSLTRSFSSSNRNSSSSPWDAEYQGRIARRNKNIRLHPDGHGQHILPGNFVSKKHPKTGAERKVLLEHALGYFWAFKVRKENSSIIVVLLIL